ncbi:putative NIT2-nitrilase [Umbelopsis sp. PMI_123]|nr:putative NIT2-nitrilase [Umbelopsis sp. PMI_123]
MTLAAVAQFCANEVLSRNRQICVDLIRGAAAGKAKAVFLPEASDFIGQNKEQVLRLTREAEVPFVSDICQAAKENNIWVSVGLHGQSSEARVYNSHILVSPDGNIAANYKKIHLFDVDIKGGARLMESEGTIPGIEIGSPVQTAIGKIGLQTCYDIRFAELSITQRARGAEILTYPSAFTVKTGAAHWESLLRARAIETQTYVIAAAQAGQHNESRASYGHAMIVDPWGQIVAHCNTSDSEPTLAFAKIDLKYLESIRTQMPVMQQRRYDLYPKLS